ncbi:porin [uncultured Psychrobacter sp.]|uniref:porin n=1 Tax=uncultured Psychrobacter sp. TaxID=259303 RepID=UPI0034586848
MRKLLLASAITIVTVPVAQAAPEIYGKAFLTSDYVNGEADYDDRGNIESPDDSDIDELQINSNFSRIGLRGSEAITTDTDVIYRLEYGIDIDGDDSGTLQSRDTYLGLKNDNYGELRVGRNSSIFSYLYDPILNRAYWDNLGKRTLNDNGGVSALNMLDYTRSSNSALWIAPEYKDLQLVLQYAADESFDNEDGEEGYGAALKLDQGTGYTAAIAYSKDIEASGSIETLDSITDDNAEGRINYGGDAFRGAVTVDVDKYINIATPLTLGAVYQQADYDFAGSDKEKGLILSGKIGLNNLNRPAFIYVQYNNTENLNGIGNNDSDQIVVGGEYNFKDNIIGHAYIGQNSADYTSPTDPTNSVADIKVFAAGAGIEYLF